MFRLVKVLNANNQCNVSKLRYNASAVIGPGCALSCSNGLLVSSASTAIPDYISITGNDDPTRDTVDAMFVTEDMVFKVEYVGSTEPYVGMIVGLATSTNKMDSVTNNTSGKAAILGIEDDKKLVYVRFRK